MIYAIEHLQTGRRYIGRSVSRSRWRVHRCDLRHGRHTAKALQADWICFGEAAFVFRVIEELPDATKALAAAREHWHLAQTVNPYNQSTLTLSGPAPGYKHTSEAIELMRQAVLGRRLSDETKRRISEARTGKKYGPRKRGYTLSTETRARMSASRQGRVETPETRAKRSATLKGRVFTDEWKANIRAAKTGKPWSEKRREAFERCAS